MLTRVVHGTRAAASFTRTLRLRDASSPSGAFTTARRRDRRATSTTTTTMATTNGDRAKPAVVFFDCDDCLYKNDWRVANMITEKIESFCSDRMSMKPGHAYELYKKWGTCLRGMQQEPSIYFDDDMLEEYLHHAHDIPLHEHIGPDPELVAMLERMDPTIPKYVFTASVKHHAERCLELLGVGHFFEDIIDVRAVDWVTKHDEEAYVAAMKIAKCDDPSACLFLDDSVSNVKTAKKVGWRTVLVGKHHRDCGSEIVCDEADHAIHRIHELPDVLGHLLVEDAVPK